MNENEYSNMFRFSLTQGDVLLCEIVFNADEFNPFTRYSIDIRDILPRTINRLQKILSKRNYDVIADVGRIDLSNEENHVYDLHTYHQQMINRYPAHYRKEMHYNPTPIIQKIDEKTIRGVECKIGLYINENPIVERLFYVDGFNPIAKESVELTETVLYIVNIIKNKIKRSDIKNMWDDYDLINKRGFTINQIREFTIGKREYLLRELKR